MRIRLLVWVTLIAVPALALSDEPAAQSPEEAFIFGEGEVVTAATLAPQSAAEAPASVTVVTAEEIRRYGYRTLTDVLRNVCGFFVVSERNYEYAGTRGFFRPGDFNNRVLLLVDGHPLNDDWIGASAIGTDLGLDMLRAERVEIVRGPGSALYGTNAVFAVVNVVTSEHAAHAGASGAATGARNLKPRATVSAEGGRWDWGDLHVEVEHPDLLGGGLLLTGSALSTEGEAEVVLPRPYGAGEDAVARNVDQDHARDVSFLYRNGPLRIDGLACTRRKVIPTQSYGTRLGDRRAHTVDARGFARAAVDGDLFGCRVTGAVTGDAFRYDGQYPYDEEEAPIAGDEADGAWIGTHVVTRRTLRTHDVTFGGGLQWHHVESSIWSAWEDGSRIETLEMPTDRYRLGQVFAQDIVTAGARWTFVVGGRYDDDSRFGGHAAGRASAAWTARPGTVVKGLVGTAFRAPSSFELHYTDGGDTQIPNPALDPEHVETVEVSFERDLGRRMHARLSAFHVHVDDLIDAVDQGTAVVQYQNTGEARSDGVEIETHLRTQGGLIAHAYVALQNVTHCESGARLPNTPRASGGAGLSVPVVREHLFASLLVRGMGTRPTLAGKRAPAYAVSDAALTYRSGDLPLEFSVRALNLLDTRYVEPGFIEHPSDTLPQPRRFIAARVIYSF